MSVFPSMPDLSLNFTDKEPDSVLYRRAEIDGFSLLIGQTPAGEICRLHILDKGVSAKSVLASWGRAWPTTIFTHDTDTRPLPFQQNEKQKILMVGTKFQQEVWAALADIPAGKTKSYAEIAAEIGNPKAARAVGGACGKNPVPLLIPCHRVVGADSLGGFTGSLALKKKLLSAEK